MSSKKTDYDLDQKRFELDEKVRLGELAIKEKEIGSRGLSTSVVTVIATICSLLSSLGVAYIGGLFERDKAITQSQIDAISKEVVQSLENAGALDLQYAKGQSEINLEIYKLEKELVLSAVNAPSQEISQRRLEFFSGIGLLEKHGKKIETYIHEKGVTALPAYSSLAEIGGLVFDQSYDQRPGYDPSFLGVNIPLPRLHDKAVVVNDDGNKELKYHHFSVFMHPTRGQASLTAANSDLRPDLKPTLSRSEYGYDTFVHDPRVSREAQITDSIYAPLKRIDRGHIVSRRSVNWGRDRDQMIYANSDVFHWTNISLQVDGFNRAHRSGEHNYNWGKLERQILKFGTGNRITIFAAPVLDPKDPIINPKNISLDNQTKIPLKFWKIVVENRSNKLNVIGFILIQNLQPAIEAGEVIGNDNKQKAGVWIASLKVLEEEIGYIEFPTILHDADIVQSGSWKSHPLSDQLDLYPNL